MEILASDWLMNALWINLERNSEITVLLGEDKSLARDPEGLVPLSAPLLSLFFLEAMDVSSFSLWQSFPPCCFCGWACQSWSETSETINLLFFQLFVSGIVFQWQKKDRYQTLITKCLKNYCLFLSFPLSPQTPNIEVSQFHQIFFSLFFIH